MATVTRSNSKATPHVYKDYVNFLAKYQNGKKEENFESDFQVRMPPVSVNAPPRNADVTDFSKSSCTSYNNYLENSKNKKFTSVKPNLEEKVEEKVEKKQELDEKTTKKTEIFIEIQPAKSVSEVSKVFESQDRKSPPKNNAINSKISIFEKQISNERKPKVSEKPVLNRYAPQKVDTSSQPRKATPPPALRIPEAAPPPQKNNLTSPPPALIISVPTPEVIPPPSKPEETVKIESDDKMMPPPPPPPMPTTNQKPNIIHNNPSPPPAPPVMNTTPPKLQATLTKGPQTTYSISNPSGAIPPEIDRNNPVVKKLVYGALRGMYGAYHDKANDMLSTLPKNMVVRSNGVQDRIEQIAANGDLDKLNGRINPKLEDCALP